MKPQPKQRHSFTAKVIWQNGVFVRMATALSRKGFDVVSLQRTGDPQTCILALEVEGLPALFPHTLVVLRQLVDVVEVIEEVEGFSGQEKAVDQHTENNRKKVAPVGHHHQQVFSKSIPRLNPSQSHETKKKQSINENNLHPLLKKIEKPGDRAMAMKQRR